MLKFSALFLLLFCYHKFITKAPWTFSAVHSCRNKDVVSHVITSVNVSASRQTCASNINTLGPNYSSLFFSRAGWLLLWNWMAMFVVSFCIKDCTEKPEIDSIWWWSSLKSNWFFFHLSQRTLYDCVCGCVCVHLDVCECGLVWKVKVLLKHWWCSVQQKNFSV